LAHFVKGADEKRLFCEETAEMLDCLRAQAAVTRNVSTIFPRWQHHIPENLRTKCKNLGALPFCALLYFGIQGNYRKVQMAKLLGTLKVDITEDSTLLDELDPKNEAHTP
jgi:hypothetical protein